jgi:hypothetical protein
VHSVDYKSTSNGDAHWINADLAVLRLRRDEQPSLVEVTAWSVRTYACPADGHSGTLTTRYHVSWPELVGEWSTPTGVVIMA